MSELTIEGMTQEQLQQCLWQAIHTVDFMRHCGIDENMRGVWLPDTRTDKLQRAIREALEHLDRNAPGAARQVLQWALTL